MTRRGVLVCALAVLGCSRAVVNVREPLGAHLGAGAATGAPVPLTFDPTARVIVSSAAGLPPATFSATQAERGQRVYAQRCGVCHRPTQFVGQEFVDAWNDRRVLDFYSLIRVTMPLSDPGSLKDGDYLDVVAYLMHANRAVPGDSLRADSTLKARRIAVRAP